MKNYKKVSSVSFAVLVLSVLLLNPILVGAEGVGLSANVKANIKSKIELRENESRDDNENDNERGEKDNGSSLKTSTVINGSSSVDLNDDRLPPGIRNAPGIEKRVENGKGLPKGLFKFFNDIFSKFVRGDKATSTHATSTDNVMPVIQNLRVISATSTANITWKTNVLTTSEIRYGTSTPINASSSVVIDSSLVSNHSVVINGLNPNTTYYYVVIAKDSKGNVKTSEVESFHTKVVDLVAPKILFNTVFSIKGVGANIAWITDEKADSRVWVGTSTPVSVSGTGTASSTDLVYFHDIFVGGLATSTQYYYVIQSVDASGNASATSTGSFMTSTN